MTKAQQKQFVKGMSKTIADDIIRAITSGNIPATWDGHELRMLLAERHAQSGRMTLIQNEPSSRRAREYRNVCTIHNL